jgi:hypothetical protein
VANIQLNNTDSVARHQFPAEPIHIMNFLNPEVRVTVNLKEGCLDVHNMTAPPLRAPLVGAGEGVEELTTQSGLVVTHQLGGRFSNQLNHDYRDNPLRLILTRGNMGFHHCLLVLIIERQVIIRH